MDLPKYVEPKEIPSAAEWNKMVACLAALTPCNSDDIIPSQTSSGTTWRLRRQKNASDDMHPFKIIGDPVAGFSVWYGTVDSIVPDGVCNGATQPIFTGTGKIYLEATVDTGGTVSGALVDVAGRVPADDEEHAHILLGEVLEDGAVYQAVIHSLSHLRIYTLTDEGLTWAHVFGAV